MTEQTRVPRPTNLSRYIDTQFYDDRPHIRGRRLPVAVIAYNAHRNGWDVPTLAREFSISEPEVLAALLYYAEHRDAIDAQERAEQAQKDEMRRLYGEES